MKVSSVSAAAGLVISLLGWAALAAEPASSGLIVFSSNRSGPWRIYTVRPDGSEMRELSKAGADEQDVDPVFNSDGKQVLFTSTRGGNVGVWKMPVDGGAAERICDGDQAEWSPDGKRIALRKKEQIVVRDLAGGSEKVVSPRDWPHCSGPAWSPDGKTIAFACRWDAANALFVVSADGGEPTKVYDKKGDLRAALLAGWKTPRLRNGNQHLYDRSGREEEPPGHLLRRRAALWAVQP